MATDARADGCAGTAGASDGPSPRPTAASVGRSVRRDIVQLRRSSSAFIRVHLRQRGLGTPCTYNVSVNVIVVVAAVIERDDHFLLTLRPPGTHLEGHWEFPGGKAHPHETHAEALRRELFEELDIVARVGPLLFRVNHNYPERSVELSFYECSFAGEPKPMLGQAIQWFARNRLRELRFPQADAELIHRLSG
jgi:8-oxo-dGTP diphosphatase